MNHQPRRAVLLLAVAIGLILINAAQLFYFSQKYNDAFYPGVFIDGVDVSGKKKSDVEQFFVQKSLAQQQQKIILRSENKEIASSAAELGIAKNYQASIERAYAVGRTENIFAKWWRLISLSPTPQKEQSSFVFDDEKIDEMIATFKAQTDFPGEDPAATLGISSRVSALKISPGKPGQELDVEKTKSELIARLMENVFTTTAETSVNAIQLTNQQIADAQTRAQKFIGKSTIFQADDVQKKLNDVDLVSLLAFPSGFSDKKIAALVDHWKSNIDRPTQDPSFSYDPKTLTVKNFTPPKKGLALDASQTRTLLRETLTKIESGSFDASSTIPLPITEKGSSINLSSTNNLGVNERIGVGDSQYFHSIPGRIHNVSLTAARINNTLVKPGAEFSFNQTLGDVSAATGFEPAYIIQGGRTVLGDGGGVCQVSTTLFRALLNGGLPVTRRVAHSYRVSYYELNSKPGVDATVYGGNVDLRFINDTGHYILIHTENDPKNLYLKVELYGTSDGRTAEIIDHNVWGIVPAPPPLYQDDPTLPRGVIKQVDFAAGGAKASFKNVVKDKNGKIIRTDEYDSNYQSWQAVYLVGTQ